MAAHIQARLRLWIRIRSEGCAESQWVAVFDRGSLQLQEGEPQVQIDAIVNVRVEDEIALQDRELSFKNVGHEVFGDMAYFSRLFDAWNAALRGRSSSAAAVRDSPHG
jgi:hypothetical protein